MTTSSRTAALHFSPDAFDIARPGLMGRQVAGHGFLRACIAAHADGEGALVGYGPGPGLAQSFRDAVEAIRPGFATRWIDLERPAGLAGAGVCHRPDPNLGGEARLRLRAGPAAYSLTGVTHTTAAPATLASLTTLASDPLMDWDAVICASEAVAETLRRQHAAHADYLRWLHGPDVRIGGPQLPVIPLGVHCDDFAIEPGERARARARLGLAEAEVAVLFVGRLAHVSKAHPAPMYLGLQAAAERTGQAVALIQCGWAPNDGVAKAFESGAAELAPAVRNLMVEGRDAAARAACWAAADVFISLSDNFQETFGLTPVEAMAAGLPCVVSDWNGYRDTVRDGVDGFRIPTWAPEAGSGEGLATALEVGTMDFHRRNWSGVISTSVDLARLADALSALVGDAELRRTMGAAARRRAREAFDWAQVIARYRALWGELDARRRAASKDPELARWLAAAPTSAPEHPDPFRAFGHYPTHAIGPATIVTRRPGGTPERFAALAAHPLWPGAVVLEAPAARALEALDAGPGAVGGLAEAMGLNLTSAVAAVGLLAKMGLVALAEPGG